MTRDTGLIRLRGVGKHYPMLTKGGHWRTLRALLWGRGDFPRFQALDGIDLDIRRGESVGLIGENGAGKSTLLKIIAGVVKPTTGEVSVNGRVGALLELGAGFHPDYTGRENIHLAAALMGLGREEVLSSLGAIIDFADIGEHIDQPIKHYSSGMVVRLGFAVATALRPDILITDEVLAVGDESFQKKCIRWMEAYLSGGGTLLLCSHGMFHIQKLCQKALWLQHGQPRMYGSAADVTREYLTYHEEKERRAKHEARLSSSGGGGGYGMAKLWMEDASGRELSRIGAGEDLTIYGTIQSSDDRTPVAGVGITRADGTPVYGLPCDVDGFRPTRLANRLYGFGFRLPRLSLLPGRYQIRVHAMDPEGIRLFDTMDCLLDVVGQSRELGYCRLEHEWLPGKNGADIPAK